MSDTATTTDASTDTATPEGATPEATAELGENGVKALTAEREARKAAEKTASELTKRLKAIEDKDKTDTQRQQEELEAAKAELDALTTAKTRAEVAAEKAIPTALLAGPASSSQEDIAKFADALIAFRGEQGSKRLTVPTEGNSPSRQSSSESEFVKNLFGKGD